MPFEQGARVRICNPDNSFFCCKGSIKSKDADDSYTLLIDFDKVTKSGFRADELEFVV